MKWLCSRLIATGFLFLSISITAIAWITSHYGWWLPLELLSHFQVQYFVLSLLLFVGLCFTRRRSLILCSLFCCILLSTQVIPWYLPPRIFTATSRADLRVLVANLNTQNRSYDRVLKLMRDEQPDLALLMEVDAAWGKQLDTLKDQLPYSFGRANPYNLGILIYSKYPLIDPEVQVWGTGGTPSLTAKVAIANQTLAFIGTHPLPPVKSAFFHSRNRQMDQAGQFAATLPEPKLLMGDLNMTPWSPYYRRLIRQTRLRNTRQGSGILPSWPVAVSYKSSPLLAVASRFFPIPIDHCLVSSSLQVAHMRVGAETGSDHRPIIVDLRFPP